MLTDYPGRGLLDDRVRDLLAQALPQPVLVTDANGSVTFVNSRWLEFTGQSWAQAMASAPPMPFTQVTAGRLARRG